MVGVSIWRDALAGVEDVGAFREGFDHMPGGGDQGRAAQVFSPTDAMDPKGIDEKDIC
jgi:hypothetical protein